ncbi:MAG TPA: PIN domain-containing protein, partial [Candidatus Saccharimonadales bacterium]|nr:PIN domain-containing protein [Candidatus Saccharimonadales bacterium]
VSKSLMVRLPGMMRRPRKKQNSKNKKQKIENGIFLDTSAIIDGRIFDVVYLGLLTGTIVITSSILLELKHLADSQDTVKRERGRKGLVALEKLKKSKKLKVVILDEEPITENKIEVDEQLIKSAKDHKGKLITCDYNLEKKANIDNVTAINLNALANVLKVIAVPGEALHVKVSHQGKEATQGVGYLDDGTMIVVEEGSGFIGKSLDVVVSRVIQTVTGRILFAKKI